MYKILAQASTYNDDIQFFYDILDAKLPSILEDITLYIKDYNSAIMAKEIYNKEWFKSLLLSVDAKVKIAIYLKKICLPYNISSITWDLITDFSTDMIDQINILQNKDNFRKSLGD